MKVIVFRQDSGRISIAYPCGNCTTEHILKHNLPANVEHRICEVDSLPKNKSFYDSWTFNNTAEPCPITIDVGAAHEIQKNKWRKARNPILESLDVQWMRAMEAGNTNLVNQLSLKKQTLRDVTLTPLPTRLQGESIDDYSKKLSAVWPECLNTTSG